MRHSKDITTGLALLLLCMPIQMVCADQETEIPLSDVPEEVLAAVRNARPGIDVHSAALTTGASGSLYEIEGDVGADEVEFTVSPDGRIVETEKE